MKYVNLAPETDSVEKLCLDHNKVRLGTVHTCNFLILCTPLNGLNTRNTRRALITERPSTEVSVCLNKKPKIMSIERKVITCSLCSNYCFFFFSQSEAFNKELAFPTLLCTLRSAHAIYLGF